MNLHDLIVRVRNMTRDLSNSIFREQDIIIWVNEAIDRVRQITPELRGMAHLREKSDRVTLLPDEYQHLLSVYCASRCFMQDERHYQASTLMNEFEVKFQDLQSKIEGGQVIIRDEEGNIIEADHIDDHVGDVYFKKRYRYDDFDRP